MKIVKFEVENLHSNARVNFFKYRAQKEYDSGCIKSRMKIVWHWMYGWMDGWIVEPG